jgi:hypothetical protein
MKVLRAAAVLTLFVVTGAPAVVLAEHGRDQIRDQLRSPDIEPTAEVVGRVVEVDHAQGAIVLETDDGLLELQGPPEALRAVSVGDVVRVLVALRDRETARPPLNKPRLQP